MKRYLTVFVLLCIVGTAHGAYFQYHAGQLRAYYEVYAHDGIFPNGSFSGTVNNLSYAWAGGGAAAPPPPQVAQASSSARSDIWRDILGNSIRIQSYSYAKGLAATTACYTRAETYARTQNSLNEYGIFYQIMPDSGEQVGDDVIVYYNDIVSITAAATTYVRIGGPGTMDHLAITRGLSSTVPTEPDRQYEVLSFPDVALSNSGGDWFSGGHTFLAEIGDVIGIFAQNYAWIEGDGPLTGEVTSWHTMILTVRAVLLGDSDYDGDVDFYDLAKLANNWLKGVGTEPLPDTTPPTPDPVQWASVPKESYHGGGTFDYWAEMTAAIATDPSGGVQYYFDCTTEDFDSGWQGSPYYEVQVGRTGQYHRFRVRARDIRGNVSLNWSSELPAVP